MLRGLLRFGVLCATVTTAADLTFLLAREVSPGVVIAGAHVGMLGLALYAVAYRSAELLLPGWPGKVVWLAGALGGGIGAAVHGTTGMAILSARPGETGTFLAPSETFGAAPAIIPPLWAFVAVLGVVGSGFFAVVVARGKSVLPRWAAAVNPALLSVAVSLVGVASPNPEAVLALSANVAHILFFGGLLVALRRAPGEVAS
ncbi:MAG: hypothetical protein AB1938_16900 [Myxococcota bacterium]